MSQVIQVNVSYLFDFRVPLLNQIDFKNIIQDIMQVKLILSFGEACKKSVFEHVSKHH